MDHDNKPINCELRDNEVIVNDDLHISFRRTIRVPDKKQQESLLPPDLGAFPLKPVSKHSQKMRAEMTAKGGIFFPMYRECHEARFPGNN
jgi:hypothetical protein